MSAGHTAELPDTVPQPSPRPIQQGGAGARAGATARRLVEAGAVLWRWSRGLVCTRIVCCHDYVQAGSGAPASQYSPVRASLVRGD